MPPVPTPAVPQFKICIVGHSLVPVDLTHPLGSVHILRLPGAHISDFRTQPLEQVFQEHWDLLILQIGGNDLCTIKSSIVFFHLQQLIQSCKHFATRVAVLGIERRRPVSGGRTPIAFRNRALVLNRALRQYCLHNQVHYCPLQLRLLYDHISNDGTHLTRLGRHNLKTRLQNFITEILCKYLFFFLSQCQMFLKLFITFSFIIIY